jgi:hypothetical protein
MRPRETFHMYRSIQDVPICFRGSMTMRGLRAKVPKRVVLRPLIRSIHDAPGRMMLRIFVPRGATIHLVLRMKVTVPVYRSIHDVQSKRRMISTAISLRVPVVIPHRCLHDVRSGMMKAKRWQGTMVSMEMPRPRGNVIPLRSVHTGIHRCLCVSGWMMMVPRVNIPDRWPKMTFVPLHFETRPSVRPCSGPGILALLRLAPGFASLRIMVATASSAAFVVVGLERTTAFW